MDIQEIKTVTKATHQTDNAYYVIQYITKEGVLLYIGTDVFESYPDSPLNVGRVEYSDGNINMHDFPLTDKTYKYIADFYNILKLINSRLEKTTSSLE